MGLIVIWKFWIMINKRAIYYHLCCWKNVTQTCNCIMSTTPCIHNLLLFFAREHKNDSSMPTLHSCLSNTLPWHDKAPMQAMPRSQSACATHVHCHGNQSQTLCVRVNSLSPTKERGMDVTPPHSSRMMKSMNTRIWIFLYPWCNGIDLSNNLTWYRKKNSNLDG